MDSSTNTTTPPDQQRNNTSRRLAQPSSAPAPPTNASAHQRLERVSGTYNLLEPIVADHAPGLLNLFGAGIFVAATLAVAAGDRPERIRNEAAWAHLCGVAPIPASSGKTTGRYRLNRGGNRQANSALHRIVLVRMGHHEPTRVYAERRRGEGRTNLEIMRSLKRYVARETFKQLPRSNT